MPKPANADSRCSTVAIRALSLTSEVDSWVSPTFCGQALISIGSGRSTRRNTMPASGRGPQRQIDLIAGMQTDAGRQNDILQGSLPNR